MFSLNCHDIHKQVYIIIIYIFLLPAVQAQQCVDRLVENTTADSAVYKAFQAKFKIDSVSLSRFENQIVNFEKADKLRNPVFSDIVFVGSSSIANWNNDLASDMKPLPVLGRGFGGSTVLENVFYFDRIVKPYKPKICVFYCENDIGPNTTRILDLFKYYEALFHLNFPNSKLYVVSLKPSNFRKDVLKYMEIVNDSLKNFVKQRKQTEFIDVYHSMFVNGKLNNEIFTSDSLHINREGYKLWTSIIKPVITKEYEIYASNEALCVEKEEVFIHDNQLYFKGIIPPFNTTIFDMSGRTVLQINNIDDSARPVALNNLQPGVYFAITQKGSKKVISKLMY